MKTFADRHDEEDRLRRKKKRRNHMEQYESMSDEEVKRLAEGPS